MMTEAAEFRQLLKYFRRQCTDPDRGGAFTQARLSEKIEAETNIPLTASTIGNWEQGYSAPRHSDWAVIVGLVKVLHVCGGITTLAEANQLLTAGNYRHLYDDEIQKINAAWIGSAKPSDEDEPVGSAPAADVNAHLETFPLDDIPAPGTMFTGSRLPFAPNPIFIGRGSQLKTLAGYIYDCLSNQSIRARTVAITGMGGVGKTQLAVEFAHRYGRYFPGGIFWFNFADAETIPIQVAACGDLDSLALLPDYNDLSLEQQIKLVKQAWHESTPRLLIFDSCEDISSLNAWRPTYGGCCTIITSQRSNWDLALGIRSINLNMFNRDESVDLLGQFLPQIAPDIAEAIANELGDYPLSLHLAGSFMRTYRGQISPLTYLTELKALRGRGILYHPSLQGVGVHHAPTDHEMNVARTFHLSYDRLDWDNKQDIIASRLLARAACLSPEKPIPKDLLLATLSPDTPGNNPPHTESTNGRSTNQSLQIINALTRLVNLGFFQEGRDGLLKPLHRLVVEFVRDLINIASAEEDVETVIINSLKARCRTVHLAPIQQWKPHLLYVARKAQRREDKQAARLSYIVGYYLTLTADYIQARRYLTWALAVLQQLAGEDHPETAYCLYYLGILTYYEGNFDEAKRYAEQALTILEDISAENPDQIVETLIGLSRILLETGEWQLANRTIERAVQVLQNSSDADESLMANALNVLGYTCFKLSRLTEAKQYLEKAWHLLQGTFGPDHPLLAENMANFGFLMMEFDEYEQARACLRQAIQIYEHQIGPEHPVVGLTRGNLAVCLSEADRFEEALPLIERAWLSFEHLFGPDHPICGLILNYSAKIYLNMERFSETQTALNRSLAIYKHLNNPLKPELATALHDMGRLLLATNKPIEAQVYLEQALAIREQKLGSTHIRTAFTLHVLGQLHLTLNDPKTAVTYWQQAQAIYTQHLGANHVKTQLICQELDNLTRLAPTLSPPD